MGTRPGYANTDMNMLHSTIANTRWNNTSAAVLKEGLSSTMYSTTKM